MITQQLVSYIEGQLSAGVTKEKIVQDLSVGGWTTEQIDEAFQATQQNTTAQSGSEVSALGVNKRNVWNKAIPKINLATAIVASGLFLFSVFGYAGGLRVFYDSDLSFFAWIMLVTMVVFGVFVFLENIVFRKKLRDHVRNGLDIWIMVLIGIRNVVVILSVIPFIQLAGMLALFFGGIPWLLIYSILLYLRFQKINSEAVTT